MKAFWWTGKANFGDALAPLLLAHFADLEVTWAPAALADIVSTGSILDALPAGWAGIVAGSGKLHDRSVHLGAARVLGVRGHLTREGAAGVVVGDPGLLASELVATSRRFALGVVPHWSDNELFARELAASRRHCYAEPRLNRVDGDPLAVIAEIGACHKIVSSSLHGVIVADSFGIPRRAEPFPLMATSPHEGGRFKWDAPAAPKRRSMKG